MTPPLQPTNETPLSCKDSETFNYYKSRYYFHLCQKNVIKEHS